MQSRETSRRLRRPLPPILLLALTILSIGMAAVVLLWGLSRMPQGEASAEIARRVAQQGESLTRFLGRQPLLHESNIASLAWQQLPPLVDGLQSAHAGLQYVEITRDGVTVFHRQITERGEGAALVSMPPFPPTPLESPAIKLPVQVTRKLVEMQGIRIPVMVFRQEIPLADGASVSVEVGLRRDLLSQQGRDAQQAVRLMFRLALLTITVAFGACLGLMIWAVRRDRRRDARRRQEEQLAFSGMLANGIVHDFRNPMSSVLLDAQMLARESRRSEGARPERLSELAERIGRTLERMDKVFKEFLFLSKPAAETPEAMSLPGCIDECLETLAPRLEAAEVTATCQAADSLPPVQASPSALRRALLNVLLNAVQFAPRGTVVELAMERAGGGRVRLDILDRGPGIPPAERRRVFEMFTSTRPGGTGLGLFLAKTAITNCHGTIEALARPGGGTLIRIELPAATEGECHDQ